MKSSLFLITFLLAFQSSAWSTIYEVDASASSVNWIGTKVVGKHNGSIKIKSGQILLDGSEWAGGEAVIDMTSITDLDLKDAKENKKLTDHLKSEDFFEVAKHPTAQLKINEIEFRGGTNYDVTGDFTIKGITEAVSFKAILLKDGDHVIARATIKIDRTRFGIQYGSGQFFQALGDKLIHDEFTLEVNIAASAN